VKNTLIGELGDIEMIREMYVVQNRTQEEIGEVLGYSKSTICRKMDKFGIDAHYNGSIHPSVSYSDGYLVASARTAVGRKNFYVHRLTAFAHFDGSIEEFPSQVHHRNKHKCDSREQNLEPLSGRQHQAVHHMDEWVEDDGWPVLLSPKFAESDT
jgi:hypothetical protein